MVDLVKIRRKAKEKKAAESHDAQSGAGEERPAEAPVEAATSTEASALEEPAVVEPAAPESKPAPSTRKLERFKATAGVVAEGEGGENGDAASEEADRHLRELLTFQLGGEQYAIDIENIMEITPPRGTTRVPNADQDVVGIISLRGTIVTVLDLRHKLGHPAAAAHGPDTRIVVADVSGQISGFFVDRVLRVIKVDPRDVESQPVVSSVEQSAYVAGVFQHSSGLSILLNIERLLSS